VRNILGIEIAAIRPSPNVKRSAWMLLGESNAYLNVRNILETENVATPLNVNRNV